MYNYDALWLTQWNLNTVLGLAYPEIYSSLVQSQLRMYEDGGLLPRGPVAGDYSWVMTGSPVTSFISGAWNKGIRDFDIDLAYEAMLDAHSLGGLFDGRCVRVRTLGQLRRCPYYFDLGYVPNEVCGGPLEGGAGQTLEYAFQDWTLGQLAGELGKCGINVAQFAEVSVSSQVNDSNLAVCGRWTAGRPFQHRSRSNVEWASAEQNPWIKLSWAEEKRVHKVVLSDRVDPRARTSNSGVSEFSDGSRSAVNGHPGRRPEQGGDLPAEAGRLGEVRGDRRHRRERGAERDRGVGQHRCRDYLTERSGNWRNLFDRSTGFIRPRGMTVAGWTRSTRCRTMTSSRRTRGRRPGSPP